jgi:RimJ/RimL family protein N-acetyltransferase
MVRPHSKRLSYELARSEHAPWFELLYMDSDVMARIPGGPMGLSAAKAAAERSIRGFPQEGLGYWVVSYQGTKEPVGYVVLRPFGWDERFEAIELGYIISKPHWGKGIASESARAVAQYALETLKIQRLLAMVHNENLHSRKVVQRLGFVPLAETPRKYPDNSLWELTLQN